MYKLFLTGFVTFWIVLGAQAAPQKIILIRHAEKIDDTHSDVSPKGYKTS